MSSTSQKHRNFVAEPMGEKPVTDLAGIGEVLGDRLMKEGYDKVLLTYSYRLIKTIIICWTMHSLSQSLSHCLSVSLFLCLSLCLFLSVSK